MRTPATLLTYSLTRSLGIHLAEGASAHELCHDNEDGADVDLVRVRVRVRVRVGVGVGVGVRVRWRRGRPRQ